MRVKNKTIIGAVFLLSTVLSSFAADLIQTGDAYAISGDALGANAAYTMAFMQSPQLSLELPFLLKRSRAGQELGRKELASAILRRAHNLAVSGADIGQTNWLLGVDAFFMTDYATAQRFFSTALLSNPDAPLEVLYYLGWSLYETGNYNQARNVFLNLFDLNQGEGQKERLDSLELQLIVASIDYKSGQFKSVIQRLANIAEYPEGHFKQLGLYLAGYSAFSLDSLGLAREFFQQMQASELKKMSLARVALEEGRFKQAIEYYSSLSTEEALYGKACAYYLKGDKKKTSKTARFSLETYPQGNLVPENHLLLAIVARDFRRPATAVGELKRGLEQESAQRPVLLLTLAEIQFARRRYQESVKACTELLETYPHYQSNEMALLLKARALFYMGKTEASYKDFNRLLSTIRDEIISNQAHYYLGEIAARRGKYLKAAEEFSKLSDGSLRPHALKRKGDVLSKAGQHNKAIASYRQALLNGLGGREKEETLLAIEENRLAIGVYPDRITMLKKFIDKYPDCASVPGIQLQIGLEYFEKGNCAAAIHEFNKLLARYPESSVCAEGLSYKADCQRKLGRIEEAISTYRRIPKSYPKAKAVFRSQEQLARLLLSLGRDAEALAVYQEISEKSPSASQRAIYTMEMASIYCDQGSYQTASDLVEIGLAESSDAVARKKGLLLGVKVELATGNLSKAQEYINRYYRKFGESPDYLIYKANLNYAQGNPQDALQSYQKAATQFPRRSEERVTALIGAAKSAILMGRRSDARSFLEKAASEAILDYQRVEITRRLSNLD